MRRGGHLKGYDKLLKQFAALGRNAKTANRKAIRAGTTVMTRYIKAATPVDEGVLQKATTNKVTGKGMNVVGIIGADQSKLDADERRPSNIDWLVEYGHVAANGVFVPPAAQIRRGGAAGEDAAKARILSKLKEEIDKGV